MTCPKCHFDFEHAAGACPRCGIRLLRNVSGVMKTSAVMIAAGTEQGFYRSVQEVPEPLRTQLLEITASQNSGTIVIADRAGKEQLTQVMARRESNREGKPQPEHLQNLPATPQIPRLPGLAWAGLVLVLAVAVLLWELFQHHW
jgi:hypothetical protein